MQVTGLISVGFPLVLVWVKLGAAFSRIAKRKGVNPKLAIVGAFPLWALFFGVWLMIQSDEARPVAETKADTSFEG